MIVSAANLCSKTVKNGSEAVKVESAAFSTSTVAAPKPPASQKDISTLIDDSYRYCKPCVQNCQNGIRSQTKSMSATSKNVQLSKLTKYSQGTATSAMIRHLLDIHNISMSVGKGCTTAGDRFVQSKLNFSSPSNAVTVCSASSLNEDLLMWLATDTLSFATVDTPVFQQLFAKQAPKAHLTSSDTMRLTTLPAVYTDLKQKVRECLLPVSTLCSMFDGSTD